MCAVAGCFYDQPDVCGAVGGSDYWVYSGNRYDVRRCLATLFGGGGTATIDFRYQATLDEAKLIDAVPKQRTFGLTDARIVTAGAAGRSVLLYRMACDGRGQMPHIGSVFCAVGGSR